MEVFGSEIIRVLASPALLISAAAIVVLLLSGLAASVVLYVEDLSHRWTAKPRLRRLTGARYRMNMGAQQKNVR